jgi:hypothetical protein
MRSWKGGGTTSDGDVRPSRSYIVILIDFSCTCGRTRQYHFVCSHYIAVAQHHNFAYKSKILCEFTIDSLVLTWSPRFEPYLDEGQWPTYTGPKYIADPGARWNKPGTRKRTRYKIVIDQVSGRTRQRRGTPFLSDPNKNKCGRCGRLGHNMRTCSWPLSQVQIVVVHYHFVLMFTSIYVYECFTSFYFIFIFVLIFVGWRHRTCSIRTMSRTTEDDAPQKGR